jgi:prevent-host-death family protein
MTRTVTAIQTRQNLGDMLNRVRLRQDSYVIERNGRPMAALVPLERLRLLEEAARIHLLDQFSQAPAVPEDEAMSLADQAKHATRPRA